MREHNLTDYLKEPDQPLVMVPVSESDGKKGIISIEQMDFLSLNQSTLNMMSLLSDWTSRTIHVASLIQNAHHQDSEKKTCLPYQKLEAAVESEYIRARTYSIPLSLICIRIKNFGFLNRNQQDLAERVVVHAFISSANKVDQLFRFRYEGVYLVLSPMRSEDDIRSLENKISTVFTETVSADETNLDIVLKSTVLKSEHDKAESFLEDCLQQSGIR